MTLLATGSFAGGSEVSFLGREMKGAAAVAVMAELEHFLREVMVLLAEEVNSSSTPIADLAESVRVLAAHASFESLSNTSRMDDRWDARHFVTRLHVEPGISTLPVKISGLPQPPLDGRTIKPQHIRRVWALLGLSGAPFPSNRAASAVLKLSGLRNDIAHRNISINEVFLEPGKTAAHLAGYLDECVLLILHMGVELEKYATKRAWHV